MHSSLRILLLLPVLFLLTLPARAFECSGQDILPDLPAETREEIDRAGDTMPYGRGLLWQAEKDGARIILFGTYHVPHAGTQAHFDALMPMARAADTVFFEMSAPDQKAFEKKSAADPSMLFLIDGPTLPDLLPEDTWQELRERMALRGMPSFMAAKFKPIYVSMLLGMSPCHLRLQKSGQQGIDGALAKALDDEGKPTRSIEDPQSTIRIFDQFPMEEQLAMIEATLAMPFNADDLQETMYRLYAAGDTGRLWEFGRALSILYGGPTGRQDFDKIEKALLTKRNHAWIAPLEEAAKPQQTVFAAVGAGHLPGEQGVLNLLAQKGWKIAPLPLD